MKLEKKVSCSEENEDGESVGGGSFPGSDFSVRKPTIGNREAFNGVHQFDPEVLKCFPDSLVDK